MAGTKPKYEWEKISREYIEAPSDDLRPSLEDLAKKYGVKFGYIQQKCAKDKWVEQSKMFLRRVSEEAQSQKISSLASEQTKFDADILIVARGLRRQITGHLSRSINTDTLIDPKDIGSLTNSLATIQKIGRTSLDMDSWTPEKILNEARRLGFLLTDPRTLTSASDEDRARLGEGRAAYSTETNPFSDILATAEEAPTTSATANDSQ
jgi:hypothetical protein